MVPLREAVVFPKTMVPFVVGRRSSLKALERVLAGDRKVFLACQRDPSMDDPPPETIRTVGTIATVVQSLEVTSGNMRMLVEGDVRARAVSITRDPEGFLLADVTPLDELAGSDDDLKRLMTRATELFEKYVRMHPSLSPETVLSAIKGDEPARLADTLAAHLVVSADVKQDLLERFVVAERLERVVDVLESETSKLELDREVDASVKERLEKAQRDYYLSEKLKAIQGELGRGGDDEGQRLRARIAEADLPEDVEKKALAEVERLETMSPSSPEATVSRSWIEWVVELPWTKRSREKRQLERARRVLDEDHHGLDPIKERILEHLAVRRLAPDRPQRAILCFVGPPGVGKTSLARSIARATGRRFVRLSLGGVRDEAEIRGHRRTYIGSLPGRILQMMRKAGTVNPLLLLDELDKMSTDFRGDPSAALLEVLDPEQNHAFLDHYLDVDYDLSDVFFIATANVLHTIPPALMDRLEIIRLPGYTLAEKLEIAKTYLIPRQLRDHGLAKREIDFPDATLREIVERWTREAGVRGLEREIARICRKLAVKVVEGALAEPHAVAIDALPDLLGPQRFRRQAVRESSELGVATGLAWTAVGGELLTPEVAVVPGTGQIILTGQIGEVMQESARAALTYVRSRAAELGIDPSVHEKRDLHIHVPAGSIPKDGPSAGIALATALVSHLASIPARADLAMTGEITLRGKVLPVGGIKEKILAAHRAGLRTVLLPEDNEKDLRELPAEVLEEIEIVFVGHLDEVLPRALERAPVPLPVVDGKPARPGTTAH
jgi:ATP-dependent Lon protease